MPLRLFDNKRRHTNPCSLNLDYFFNVLAHDRYRLSRLVDYVHRRNDRYPMQIDTDRRGQITGFSEIREKKKD